ncbi:hypothetical protein OG716_31175 [Nocardia sp. NBC_01388]
MIEIVLIDMAAGGFECGPADYETHHIRPERRDAEEVVFGQCGGGAQVGPFLVVLPDAVDIDAAQQHGAAGVIGYAGALSHDRVQGSYLVRGGIGEWGGVDGGGAAGERYCQGGEGVSTRWRNVKYVLVI